ncbi:hypothetical protein [Crateriforma spongiae]|uniref:hypothetical protein n=1 Tax=Crateriforma spongiae TaxID=2724528 RepID=UPI0039AF1F30
MAVRTDSSPECKSRSLRHAKGAAAGLLAALSLAGCANWRQNETEPVVTHKAESVQTLHHRTDALVMSSRFVTIRPPESIAKSAERLSAEATLDGMADQESESRPSGDSFQPDPWDTIWNWVDETVVDAGDRRRLLDNGLRVGLVKDPQKVDQLLAEMTPPSDLINDFMEQTEVATDVSGLSGAFPVRWAERTELWVRRADSKTRTVLARIDGQTVGRTLDAPQPLFALEANPTSMAGQIRLTFRPEIQHGPMKRSFTPSKAAVRMEQRRDAWSLAENQWDVRLGEGDVLIVAPTRTTQALGKAMLTQQTADQQTFHTVVLLTLDRIP